MSRRLFVALQLEPSVRAELYKLEEKLIFHRGGFAKVPEANMHMTVLFIGEVSEEKAQRLAEDFKKISFSLFEYRIRGLGVFPNPHFVRAVWAGCEAREPGRFEALYREVRDKLGATAEEKFVPHLTLERARTKDASMAAAEFVRDHERIDLGMTAAKRIALMESVLGQGGARYSEMAAIEAQ